MGESTARRPQVGSSTARAPRVLSSVATAPRVGSSVAPVGSVPPRYSPIPSVVGDAVLRVLTGGSVSGVAAVAATASVRLLVSSELETEIKMIDVDSSMGVAAAGVVVPVVESVATVPVVVSSEVVPVVDGSAVLALSASAVTAFAPTPMGMDKDSSAFSAPSGSGFASPTGWVQRSGYVSTVISGDALRVSVAGSYAIHARVTFQASATGNRVRILVNGVAVSTSEAGTATPSTSVVMALAVGDVVAMEVASNGGATSRVVLSGSSNTFLYFDVA